MISNSVQICPIIDLSPDLYAFLKRTPISYLNSKAPQSEDNVSKIEIYLNYSNNKRPDDDSRKVFIFYRKNEKVYIDKHLYNCPPEKIRYKLEFYI